RDLVPHMIRDQVMLIGPGSTGDIANMSEADVLRLPKTRGFDPRALVAFRFKAQKQHIVVLRLGSVCFSVGVITSDYRWDDRYAEVYSFWNAQNAFYPGEWPWDLKHARRVNWYGLTDKEALCAFRKGIYGGRQRFCRVADGGKASAKQHLDEYLWNKLGYDNTNGESVLRSIGK